MSGIFLVECAHCMHMNALYYSVTEVGKLTSSNISQIAHIASQGKSSGRPEFSVFLYTYPINIL